MPINNLRADVKRMRSDSFHWCPVVTEVMDSVNHTYEQCCYVPWTALPIRTLGPGTEGLVPR